MSREERNRDFQASEGRGFRLFGELFVKVIDKFLGIFQVLWGFPSLFMCPVTFPVYFILKLLASSVLSGINNLLDFVFWFLSFNDGWWSRVSWLCGKFRFMVWGEEDFVEYWVY
jgi:hypothetical protein